MSSQDNRRGSSAIPRIGGHGIVWAKRGKLPVSASKKQSSGEEYLWEKQPEKHQIRGWIGLMLPFRCAEARVQGVVLLDTGSLSSHSKTGQTKLASDMPLRVGQTLETTQHAHVNSRTASTPCGGEVLHGVISGVSSETFFKQWLWR